MLRILSISMLICSALWPIPGAPAASPPDGPAQGLQSLALVDLRTMPHVDVQTLLAQDRQRAARGDPLLRFAYPFEVDYSPSSAGTWEHLAGGLSVWRLRIASPGARSLNLGFGRYHMPPGGRLYIYDAGYRSVLGPFTGEDNESHRQLWTPIVPGDEVVVELQIPAAQLPDLELELSSVNHGYTDFWAPASLLSGSCNLDVVCSAADGYPQVDPWRDQIRSVAVYQRSGQWACTGTMINNTAQDLTPYFLTAHHCGVDESTAPTMVVYWNYENSWCRPPGSASSGQPGDGSLAHYQTGALFRADYGPSDMTLVELDDDPDEEWDVYWAGWDRSNADTTSAAGIHHPSTEEKRISFEDDATTTTSYLQISVPGDGTHIRVTDWDLGTTEPGSSGSPLFNQDRRVVGQLHGGYAACGNEESDWYGRFSVSWAGGGTPATRLSNWLDPLGTGSTVLDGRGPVNTDFTLQVSPSTLDVCAPAAATLDVAVGQHRPGVEDPVTLGASGYPPGTTAAFELNPVVPPATSTLTIDDTGAASAGTYQVAVQGTAASGQLEAMATLDLYTAVPAPPILLSPPDGAQNQDATPAFSWNGASQAGSYEIELDRTPLFHSPLIDASSIDGTTYAAGTSLDQGRCYWWHVRGDNACGSGDWAAPFHFATARLAALFTDAIESGAGNWTHAAGVGDDDWQITAIRFHSPDHAWFVPDDSYVTDSRLWNTLPLSVGTGTRLTFWHRYDFEDGFDGAVLEISTGDGTWTDLGPYIDADHAYTGAISVGYGNPLAGRQAWTGEVNEWEQVTVDLTSFAGQAVQIRWRLGSDASLGDTGWYVDDVEITTPLPPEPAPTLQRILPGAGSLYVDTPIRIVGTNFTQTPTVELGGTWLWPVTRVSPTLVEATVPAGLAGGTYDLVLYNGDCQQASLQNAYTSTAECIAPALSLSSDSPVDLGQPLHVEATLLAGTLPLTYTWDFGGPGHGHALSTATPVFTYTNSGDYFVQALVQGLCGSTTLAEPVTVQGGPASIYLPLVVERGFP